MVSSKPQGSTFNTMIKCIQRNDLTRQNVLELQYPMIYLTSLLIRSKQSSDMVLRVRFYEPGLIFVHESLYFPTHITHFAGQV